MSQNLAADFDAYLALKKRLAYAMLSTSTADVPHSIIAGNSYYSPWLADHAFWRNYQAVRSATMLDLPCLYELWSLVGQLGHLDGDIIEVGTWRGGSGCTLAMRAAELRPAARVFLCDTFAGVVQAGPEDSYYRGGEHADATPAQVRALANQLGLTNVQICEGVFPAETGTRLSDRQFRFAHVDVDTYRSARESVEWIWPRLVVGGVLVLDDYGSVKCPGIARCVNLYKGLKDRVVIYNGNGQAVLVKTTA